MDIRKLMKQAGKIKKVQKELKKAVVKEEVNGISLSVTGDGKVKDFRIPDEVIKDSGANLEKDIKNLIEICLKKQSALQQEKAKQAMGGMGGLSDLMG